LLATLTDGEAPAGLDVDSTGTLYVSEQGTETINVYAPGATVATSVLSDPGEYPFGVAHCSDGTTYVANTALGNGSGNITFYAAGATTPTGTIPDPAIENAYGVACDANANVYADYSDTSHAVQIVKYGPQGSSITNTGFGAYMSNVGQIRVTPSGILAASDISRSILFFRLAAPGAGPFLTSTWNANFFGFSLGLVVQDAFVADRESLPLIGQTRNERRRYGLPQSGGSPQAKTVFRANARNLRLVEVYGAGVLNDPSDAFVYPGGNT
jgi:hypothetical protein